MLRTAADHVTSFVREHSDPLTRNKRLHMTSILIIVNAIYLVIGGCVFNFIEYHQYLNRRQEAKDEAAQWLGKVYSLTI